MKNRDEMILILSINGDSSTNDVIDWLEHYDASYFRLNDDDLYEKYNVNFYITVDCKIEFRILDKQGKLLVNSNEIKKVWFRKFGFFKNFERFQYISEKFGRGFADQLEKEFHSVVNLLYKCLSSKKWLTEYKSLHLNKLWVLGEAKNCGLMIPKSICTNSSTFLFSSFLCDEKLITKSIRDGEFIRFADKMLGMYTVEVPARTSDFPRHFSFSLVQNKVEKAFEVRSFYIDGQFYSMAILSQKDPQTRTDFRKYNYTKPNRWLPYSLPSDVENKLNVLMRNLKMNTGSIDLIYTRDNDYIFLEVNPTGQFGMISKVCNYPIERDIAKYLINMQY